MPGWKFGVCVVSLFRSSLHTRVSLCLSLHKERQEEWVSFEGMETSLYTKKSFHQGGERKNFFRIMTQ